MSTKEEPEGGVAPSADGKGLSAEQVGQMINSALSSHFKRFKSDLEMLVKPPEDKKKEETQLQTALRKLEEFEQRAVKAESEAREQRTEGRLRSTLAKRGLAEDQQELALAYLKSKGLVTHGEDGEPIVTLKKAKTKGGVPEPLQYTLEDGVGEWLSNDATAKPLLPAPKPTGKPAPTPGALSAANPALPQQGKRKMSERETNTMIGQMMSGVEVPSSD